VSINRQQRFNLTGACTQGRVGSGDDSDGSNGGCDSEVIVIMVKQAAFSIQAKVESILDIPKRVMGSTINN